MESQELVPKLITPEISPTPEKTPEINQHHHHQIKKKNIRVSRELALEFCHLVLFQFSVEELSQVCSGLGLGLGLRAELRLGKWLKDWGV
jgi:hypothetical protein